MFSLEILRGNIMDGSSTSTGMLPRQQGGRLIKNRRTVMSLAIRGLPMAVRGVCALCKTEQELSSWDSNLGGRVCRDCEPFLDAAENALVAAKYGHPCDTLVLSNP
jgi:hypothetical protein